jgi:hypothetical protein
LKQCIIIDSDDEEEPVETVQEVENSAEQVQEAEIPVETETDTKIVNWSNLPDDTIRIIREYIPEETKVDLLVWKYGNINQILGKVLKPKHLVRLLSNVSIYWNDSRFCNERNFKTSYIQDIFGELLSRGNIYRQERLIKERIYCIDLILKKHYNTSLSLQNTTSQKAYDEMKHWRSLDEYEREMLSLENKRVKYECMIYNPVPFENSHQRNVMMARRTTLRVDINLQVPLVF